MPPAVWAVTVLHTLVLALYSALTPTYQAPDEPLHLDLVRVLAHGDGWPVHGTRLLDRQIDASFAVVDFDAAVRGEGLDADAPPRSTRPAFAELGPSRPVTVGGFNQLTQHPPGYYVVAAAVLRGLERLGAAAWPFDRVVGALRLLSVVLLAPLPLLAHAAARRLGAAAPVAVAAALFPVAIPQLSHVGASINNDVLLVALCAVETLLLVRVACGDLSLRTALLVGVVAGAALLTKGLALVVVPWIAVAYAVAAVRATARGEALLRGAVALAVAVVTGGWWWLRNLVVTGRVLPAVDAPSPVPGPGFDPNPLGWAVVWLRNFQQTFWGHFGWLTAEVPIALVWGAAVLTAAGVAAAVVGSRGSAWRRPDLLVVLLPGVALSAGLALQSWLDHVATGVYRAIQGRYAFAGVTGLGVAVALGYGTVERGRRWLPVGVLAAAGVLQLVGLGTILAHFWPLPGGLGASLAGALAWSPWPTAVPVAVGVAAAAAAVGVAVLVVRDPTAAEAENLIAMHEDLLRR